MDTSILIPIIILIAFLAIMAVASYILTLIAFERFCNRYLDIKEREVYNKTNELLANLDPSLANEEIDNMIGDYIEKYSLNVLIANDITYLSDAEIKKMERQVTKDVYSNLSELYIFYILMGNNINDEDELLKYIYNKVKEKLVPFVVNFNALKE